MSSSQTRCGYGFGVFVVIALVFGHVVCSLLCHWRIILEFARRLNSSFTEPWVVVGSLRHDTDCHTRKIRKLMDEQRRKLCKGRMEIVAHILAMFVLAHLGTCQFFFIAFFVFPLVVTCRINCLAVPRVADLIQAGWVAATLAFNVLFPGWSMWRMVFSVAMRTLSIFMHCSIMATVMLNCAHVCGILLIYLFQDIGPWEATYSVMCVAEVTVAVALIILAWLIYSAQASAARAMLETQLSSQNEAVVHRLLSAMCDAVVQLDRHLSIQQPSPKLEVMLLRHDSANGLAGTPFQDLLFSTTESDEFVRKLSQGMTAEVAVATAEDGAGRTNLAGSLPSRMRDGCGTMVSVQLFYTSFHDLDDRLCYLIGVRENIDEGVHIFASDNANMLGGDLLEMAAAPIGGLHLQSGSRQSDTESQGSSGNCSSELDPGKIMICINLQEELWPVTQSTISFTTLCGPSGHRVKFWRWVMKEQRHVFIRWLQHNHNRSLNGMETARFSNLVLQPLHLSRHRVWIKTDVMIVSPSDDSFIADDELSVQLELCELEWCHGSPTRRTLGALSNRPQAQPLGRHTIVSV